MPLAPGTRLGSYEIGAQIGVGGMGEVYRATDTSLGRDVAIKVLPDEFAQDAERLARFEREARTLASLNHPNIAIVHGLERADGVRALVMELVEGPTLADRISGGPMPVDEALAIAREIAAALEAAHEQGIVHRDLKPANVKVRPDGTVKVLDFGLAKTLEPPAAASTGRSMSPTITSPAMTQLGMILGTAAYMSPEQARGRGADRRSDIWSFGAVLYEMLTGRRAFSGEEVSDVLASVLAREPDWSLLPTALSQSIAAHLKRCLQKDRKQRLRDIGDFSLALDGAFDAAPAHAADSSAAPRSKWRRPLALTLALVTGAAIALIGAWQLWPTPGQQSTARFEHVLPAGQEFATTQRPLIAISPDGRRFVYQGTDGLYLRAADDVSARLIPGSADVRNLPFFSPNGEWVGYWTAPGALKKIAVGGGEPVTVCPAEIPFGASWSADDSILFAQRTGIMRVSANGGKPELLIPARNGEQLLGPQLLPGGRSVLFSATTDTTGNRWNVAQVVVQSLSGERTVLVDGGSDARYLPTGHLVYAVRDAVFGVAFDLRRSAISGGAVPLVQGIQMPVGVNAGGSNFTVSDNGTLLYVSGASALRSLTWINRDGTTGGSITSIPPGPYEDPRLSPDGDRVLLTRDGDIWIYELGAGRSNRLTRDGSSLMGVWHPSGSHVAYSSARGGNLEAWISPSDGSGEPRQLTKLGGQIHVDRWSPDGKTLSIHRHSFEGPVSILMLPMDRVDQEPNLFLEGRPSVEGADFSRDGRYVTYISFETGRREIYIRPYPGPGGQITASAGGGREPMWIPNGDVVYRSLRGDQMFAVPVATTPALKIGAPALLFQGPYYVSPTGSPRAQYDVTADGQRFLMLTPSQESGAQGRSRVVVVQNWFEELRRILPSN